jgi:hypothetical protein
LRAEKTDGRTIRDGPAVMISVAGITGNNRMSRLRMLELEFRSLRGKRKWIAARFVAWRG